MPHRNILTATAMIACAALSLSAHAQFTQPGTTTEPTTVLSKIHGGVEAGWYAASELYRYNADVNVAFNYGTWENAYFTFGGGILTYIESSNQQGFQPSRYRGTLEASVNLPQDQNVYSFRIRHHSFHNIDQPANGAESYELYLLGYERHGTPDYVFTAGNYLHTNGVDYTWNLFAGADVIPLVQYSKGTIYTSGFGSFVFENGSLPNRDGFLDYSLELGFRTKSGVRYFSAYRQIHDINMFNGVTDHQLLIGIKYIW